MLAMESFVGPIMLGGLLKQGMRGHPALLFITRVLFSGGSMNADILASSSLRIILNLPPSPAMIEAL